MATCRSMVILSLVVLGIEVVAGDGEIFVSDTEKGSSSRS